MLDPKMFIRLLQPGDPNTVESDIVDAQNRLASVMDKWDDKEPLVKTIIDEGTYIWTHPKTRKLVIPPDPELYRRIVREWHDLPTAGHLGRDETIRRISEVCYWPNVSTWVMQYV